MFALEANAPPPRAPSERLRQAGGTKSISHGPGDRGDFWASAAQWTPCKHTPQEVTEPVSTWPWSWSAPRQTAAFISCSGLKQYVAAGSSTQVSANIQSRRSIFFRSHLACNTGIKQRQISFEMAVWLWTPCLWKNPMHFHLNKLKIQNPLHLMLLPFHLFKWFVRCVKWQKWIFYPRSNTKLNIFMITGLSIFSGRYF